MIRTTRNGTGFDPASEWLETDGLGGFASGTAGLVRTRRYHALLLSAAKPPWGRVVLVNGLEAWVETRAGSFPVSSQLYSPGVLHPDGQGRIERFDYRPWPRWTFALQKGARVRQEILVSRPAGATILRWRLERPRAGVLLAVRLLVSGRDYHSLHRENRLFRFDPEERAGSLVFRPYDGLPAIVVSSNGQYRHQPTWYRNFLYEEERERGLDFIEDLASPGLFRFDLSRGEAALILAAEPPGKTVSLPPPVQAARLASSEERRRRVFVSLLDRAADDYIVRRGAGKTIVAGYPWFTDWGRDTFIALRGLCLATGRLEDARAILLQWAAAVSDGMLPNRFPDQGDQPEFNSVDASLWYVMAVHDFLAACKARRRSRAGERERRALGDAVGKILTGYAGGTRYRIGADEDGLLAAGVPGIQLTWMDAKVGDRVVTPRIGKPVEVQALWINALKIGSRFSQRWNAMAEKAAASFEERFWNEEAGGLFDVVDCDHVRGTADPSFRPNQIYAVGGLPFPILAGDRARRVVDTVEQRLWTPMGLRSLSPWEPGYVGRYRGDPASRDGAYHQGAVWPFLAGAFVEAWVRVRGDSADVRREARERFLAPLLAHLETAGLGHISEIADGDPPHRPRGCPFQAWSVGEALRLDRVVLAGERAG
jgi:predicted glycogen debranching enzyme